MLGINYIKFGPMDYVLHYRNGKIVKEGPGLSFFYLNRNSSIVSIPRNTRDIPFAFQDMTSDYQNVTVQGQITYCITEPRQINKQLDFSVNQAKGYLTDDFEKLTQRLVNEAQTSISSFVHRLPITEVLSEYDNLEDRLIEGLRNSKVVINLGIEVLSVSVLKISADPDMSRALEATTREALQQEADKAIYERRNFAVEAERRIKDSELNTEIAVEEKQKQIVEKKMETDRTRRENEGELKRLEMESHLRIEALNKDLVKMKAANLREEADAEGYRVESVMKAYRDVDWRVLNALNAGGGDARNNIALAFRELATNAEKIGNLNVSPDLVSALLHEREL